MRVDFPRSKRWELSLKTPVYFSLARGFFLSAPACMPPKIYQVGSAETLARSNACTAVRPSLDLSCIHYGRVACFLGKPTYFAQSRGETRLDRSRRGERSGPPLLARLLRRACPSGLRRCGHLCPRGPYIISTGYCQMAIVRHKIYCVVRLFRCPIRPTR
jgi:hypothetical protein